MDRRLVKDRYAIDAFIVYFSKTNGSIMFAKQ